MPISQKYTDHLSPNVCQYYIVWYNFIYVVKKSESVPLQIHRHLRCDMDCTDVSPFGNCYFHDSSSSNPLNMNAFLHMCMFLSSVLRTYPPRQPRLALNSRSPVSVSWILSLRTDIIRLALLNSLWFLAHTPCTLLSLLSIELLWI